MSNKIKHETQEEKSSRVSHWQPSNLLEAADAAKTSLVTADGARAQTARERVDCNYDLRTGTADKRC